MKLWPLAFFFSNVCLAVECLDPLVMMDYIYTKEEFKEVYGSYNPSTKIGGSDFLLEEIPDKYFKILNDEENNEKLFVEFSDIIGCKSEEDLNGYYDTICGETQKAENEWFNEERGKCKLICDENKRDFDCLNKISTCIKEEESKFMNFIRAKNEEILSNSNCSKLKMGKYTLISSNKEILQVMIDTGKFFTLKEFLLKKMKVIDSNETKIGRYMRRLKAFLKRKNEIKGDLYNKTTSDANLKVGSTMKFGRFGMPYYNRKVIKDKGSDMVTTKIINISTKNLVEPF